MSKILKNQTASIVDLSDTGKQVPASGQLLINPTDYSIFAQSDETVTAIGNGTLVVSDGSNDLSISDGVDLIKDIFPTEIDVNVNPGTQTLAVEPSKRVVHVDRRFTNGSNTSMDVNGSSTNQEFEFSPPSDQTWYVHSLQLLIADGGSTDVGDFGSINGGLSNGVQLIAEIGGTEYQIGNFTDNASISLCFSEHAFTASGTGESTGWFDNTDFFMGVKDFRPYPIELRGADGDRMFFRIRDNITGLNEFEAVARAFRVIS